ncbi:hypothetical protein ACFLU0_00675 [Chloroflexota bacterium]
MKRVILGLLLAALLTLTLGTSIALAAGPPEYNGPPDAIYIDHNAEFKSDVVTFIKDEIKGGKPEIWMKKDGTWIHVNQGATQICPECGASVSISNPECPECGSEIK